MKQPFKLQGQSFRTAFAAFMSGALIVGSLMFASDKLNLFTGGVQPLVAGTAAAAGTSANGGVQTASYSASGPGTISEIAKAASPAVVKIETKTKASGSGSNSLYNSPFFRQFMGDGGSGQPQQDGSGGLQESGLGSGFIFDSSGYILTNEHVIDGADEIDVYVQGYDKPFQAKLLGSSYDLDLAVLKIEGDKAFPSLAIGNSDDAQVGDWVVAIGNPYDFDYTVTAGVLSAKDRPISIDDTEGTRNYKHLLQTDTAINPGNSGGPLLNMNGEVIGINTAVNAEAQGIGFAIPTSTISSVLDNLKTGKTIPKEPAPYIGVSVQDVTSDMLGDLQLKSTDGALVAAVQRQTPAFAAGIRQYDVITAVNGKQVASADELTKQIQAAKVGDELTITISRGGQTQNVSVKVGDKNAASN
ncbi:S1C family serine protease [Gordoniibacillus kamchatkensis]|uniref:S1C family serine protease n=1 Tax=Gordoniibacillus kamchatkensis TaxID=1590651 RepID=UPI001E55F7B6|nr:trypsin-like peptidase domain-containing protein [Paenibacillus sp. VKM B-2647]